MFATLPWELPSDLPWQVYTSPLQKWATQPSFVVGEHLFFALAGLSLWHALRNGRAHLFCWVAAIVAGTSNDIIFMALPLVDNFWQAQATVMLTPRLPLYIPCVYVCFMYIPTVAVWRLGLSGLPRASLSGLAAIAFYAPYDIVGAKFLWWTWHDTDMPIARRLVGVPMGSTIWVITFVATFAWLVGKVVDRNPEVAPRRFFGGLVAVAALCSVLMVMQMTAWQQLDGGVPGPVGLMLLVACYAGMSVAGLRQGRSAPAGMGDRLLGLSALAYFGVLTVIVSGFDPVTHRSESLHQTYGPCGVEATDIAGFKREKYLCGDHFDEDFSFSCVQARPPPMTQWYTVCGRPFANRALWVSAVAGWGVSGGLLFALLFRVVLPRRRRRDPIPS